METIENLLKNKRKAKERPSEASTGQRKAMGRHKGSKMEAKWRPREATWKPK